jgi:DNA-binding transcriptional regulator YdaS (Cro superfamily)
MPYIAGMDDKAEINKNTACDALRRICDADGVGGPSGLARRLNVKPPTVSQWLSGNRPIPADRCPDLEEIGGGVATCEELRPDVNWAVLRRSRVAA